MYEDTSPERTAILDGCIWLLGLQNSDGGFPTFCRGWGGLPFDSSCADLTGHAILAFSKTLERLGNNIPAPTQRKINKCVLKAARYLQKHQAQEGYWLPLWFGNQCTSDHKNPVYGTAKVCIYLQDCLLNNSISAELRTQLLIMISHAEQYLFSQQNSNGSWGGKKDISGTIEETSLAISALSKNNHAARIKGFEWLSDEYRNNDLRPGPIGLYFAALWYDEQMYPLIYYIEALRRFLTE